MLRFVSRFSTVRLATALFFVGAAMSAGLTGTAQAETGVVAARDTLRIPLVGDGTIWNVYLNGDGDTDLDLRVYNAYGRLLDTSLSYNDVEHVRFTAQCGEVYILEIENLGGVWNEFELDAY